MTSRHTAGVDLGFDAATAFYDRTFYPGPGQFWLGPGGADAPEPDETFSMDDLYWRLPGCPTIIVFTEVPYGPLHLTAAQGAPSADTNAARTTELTMDVQEPQFAHSISDNGDASYDPVFVPQAPGLHRVRIDRWPESSDRQETMLLRFWLA